MTLQTLSMPEHGTVQSLRSEVTCSAHLDVLRGTRLHEHASAMLHSPSDDHLLGNAVTLLANLPDDGILHIHLED